VRELSLRRRECGELGRTLDKVHTARMLKLQAEIKEHQAKTGGELPKPQPVPIGSSLFVVALQFARKLASFPDEREVILAVMRKFECAVHVKLRRVEELRLGVLKWRATVKKDAHSAAQLPPKATAPDLASPEDFPAL